MTVTASATDRDLVGAVEGAVYAFVKAPPAGGYTVRTRPTFHLELERAGASWAVVDRETGIYGAGETPTEALADFGRAAAEHLDVLERQDALSPELAKQLEYLRVRVARGA